MCNVVSQNQFPTSLDCFHICRVQQIQSSSDTIRISSVISGEDHSSCPEKVPGFILYFLFSLFSPYAHPIFIASEITLMGARKIYLFTYLKPTPQFFILATGTQFCSHIEYVLSVAFTVLLQWLLLQLAGVLTLVTFHLFPFACSSDVFFAFQDLLYLVSM